MDLPVKTFAILSLMYMLHTVIDMCTTNCTKQQSKYAFRYLGDVFIGDLLVLIQTYITPLVFDVEPLDGTEMLHFWVLYVGAAYCFKLLPTIYDLGKKLCQYLQQH